MRRHFQALDASEQVGECLFQFADAAVELGMCDGVGILHHFQQAFQILVSADSFGSGFPRP